MQRSITRVIVGVHDKEDLERLRVPIMLGVLNGEALLPHTSVERVVELDCVVHVVHLRANFGTQLNSGGACGVPGSKQPVQGGQQSGTRRLQQQPARTCAETGAALWPCLHFA